jgi:hypothetical protein
MALMVIVAGTGADFEQKIASWNQGRFLTGSVSKEQQYLGEDGPVTYGIDSAVWEHFDIPVIYSDHLKPLDTFRHLMVDDRTTRPDGALGLSPFGSFKIDLSPFAGFADTRAGDGLEDAVEVALVMQVSSQRVAPLSHDVVSSCGPAH